jgi:sulfate adenylyltransferase large subunit
MFAQTHDWPAAAEAASEESGSSRGLLRFSTAGSVDDGKSTLIGRLLYDSKALYEDQIASVRKTGINRSAGALDLSLFTDGLRAEREQAITIDVAYRYFSTPKRKFIIADTPGHEQYTRNMATGASTADAAVVLIDATKGLLPQSRRHICIASLLGIGHIIAAVNKMDLLGYSEDAFRAVEADFGRFCKKLNVPHTYAIPVSAVEGANVTRRARQMEWFRGPALLELLEYLPASSGEHSAPLRFPVQRVCRPDATFRGFAGSVVRGSLRRGARVTALPSGTTTRIRSIVTYNGEMEESARGSVVTVTLDDEIDLSRGDLIVDGLSRPQTSGQFTASLVWLHSNAMKPGMDFLLKHTTRVVRARIVAIRHRLDVNSLSCDKAGTLQMNDIASVEIETSLPLHFDLYDEDRTMGSFILIDPLHNGTVAAGMITGANGAADEPAVLEPIQLADRIARNGHPPVAVWLVNQSDAAASLEREIFQRGWHAQVLSESDFEPSELGTAARVLRTSGAIAIFSVSSQTESQRDEVQQIFGKHQFIEPVSEQTRNSAIAEMVINHVQQLQRGEA